MNNGLGSSQAFSDLIVAESLNTYAPSLLSERKARLALRKVAVLDTHLASPALAANAERIRNIALEVLSCVNVTCPSPTNCQNAVQCTSGRCPSLPAKQNGTFCDDGDIKTDFDMCSSGVCRGIDLCANTTCASPSPCQVFNGCFRGVCSYATKGDGAVCDDGNANTYNDACVAGLCGGVEPCANVTCEESVCRFAGECMRPAGVCSLGAAKPSTALCDDGNNRTIDDACADGLCRGVDPCEALAVTCRPLDQCRHAGACFLGLCSNPLKSDDTPCNDGDGRTTGDVCRRGVCSGVDECDRQGVICIAQDDCHDVGDCYQGQCTNPVLPDGISCDDGNLTTDNDRCLQGVCRGVDLCEGVSCPALSQCYRPGSCRHGVCAEAYQADGTLCNDNDPMTEFDTCFQGVCTGIVQPTIGPLKQTVGLKTQSVVSISGVPASSAAALAQFLSNYLASFIPSVYLKDVDVTVTAAARTRRDTIASLVLNISIDTRAFSEEYILSQLSMALQNPDLVIALRQAFPQLLSVDVLQSPRSGNHI